MSHSADDRALAGNVEQRVRDLLGDARTAQDSGHWRMAQSLIAAVLALDPTNDEARGMLHGSAVRRQMTLLFCDIVDSTRLADSRDPEETTALLGAYRAVCSEIIDQYGGFIDDHRGDGMLVLFGYPQVNEDDARRAVECGLAIARSLSRRVRGRHPDIDAEALRVRIAVHTDLVVLDGVGVAGATANEAARIQDHAPPDTVVISDATKALVWPHFETASIGIVTLRGVSRPVEVFSVVRERATSGRAVPAGSFVGREAELARIHDFVRSDARILLVSGQAGIGKTRLVREAAQRFRIQIFECRASRTQQNVSLHVFRPLIEHTCGINTTDSVDVRLAKLRGSLGATMIQHGDLPFLAGAVGIPLSALPPPVDVDPSSLRQIALGAAAEHIDGHLGRSSAVILVDDAHWADRSSAELIGQLSAIDASSVRLILTARDGFDAPWPDSSVLRLALDPLERSDLVALADGFPGTVNLPAEDLDELIERSDGVPLFLEELLRTADELGRGHVVHRSIRYGEYGIPPALRDPLLARLASPSVDLEMVQAAATIGRDVDRGLLQKVLGAATDDYDGRIESLLTSGLIEESERGFRFRHELIREVAYESQRRTTARANHSSVADAMATDADATPRHVSERASHLERAERYGEAIITHIQVAQADQALGAHSEVVNRLTRAIELVDEIPDSTDRFKTELLIRRMRSFSTVTAQGYGAPEAALDYDRTTELGELLVAAPETVDALFNSWTYYVFRGQIDRADEIAAVLTEKCPAVGIPPVIVDICFGIDEFFRGHFSRSAELADAFIHSEWINAPVTPPSVMQLPSDPVGVVDAHQGFTRWVQGDPARAAACFLAAEQRVARLGFPFAPFTACYVDHFQALVAILQDDHRKVAEIGAHMKQLADRHGFALWQITAGLHLSASAVMLGHQDALPGFAELVGVARDLLGALVYTPFWLTRLAVAQTAGGLASAARQSLDQAVELAEETQSRFYSAETLRLRGESRLAEGDPDGLSDLRRAVALAESQGALVLADRARASAAGAAS